MITVKQYNDGRIDVTTSRRGRVRTHKNVKSASIIRLAKATQYREKQVFHSAGWMEIKIS